MESLKRKKKNKINLVQCDLCGISLMNQDIIQSLLKYAKWLNSYGHASYHEYILDRLRLLALVLYQMYFLEPRKIRKNNKFKLKFKFGQQKWIIRLIIMNFYILQLINLIKHNII